MEENIPNNIIWLAPALGMLHALDTDHLVAVSALAGGRRNQYCRAWIYGLRWALGHGTALLVLGLIVFGLGRGIPLILGTFAESLVALIMIGMGTALFVQLYRVQPAGTAWLHADIPLIKQHRHQPAAAGLGALHGMAGSASLLALVPAAASGSAWQGLMYLVLFSIGVILSMLLCTSALGALFFHLKRYGNTALATLRYIIAGASVLVGALLLVSLL